MGLQSTRRRRLPLLLVGVVPREGKPRSWCDDGTHNDEPGLPRGCGGYGEGAVFEMKRLAIQVLRAVRGPKTTATAPIESEAELPPVAHRLQLKVMRYVVNLHTLGLEPPSVGIASTSPAI